MQISEELRQSVIRSLPEVNEISDETLRNQVIDAWAYSLGKSSFKSIDEIRASGNPDTPPLKRGTQTHHIRGVTLLAMRTYDELTGMFPELECRSRSPDCLCVVPRCGQAVGVRSRKPSALARIAGCCRVSINSASGLRCACLPDCRTPGGGCTYSGCPFGRG